MGGDQYYTENGQQMYGPSSGAPAPAQPQGGGVLSGLERFLPTAGAIGGGIAGAALAPETGGLSLLLPIALAALGSGGGKAVEDIASKQPLNPVGIAENAAMGAAGQGVGELASTAVGGVGDLLANSATKEATNAADTAYSAPFKLIEGSPVAQGEANDLNSTVNFMKSLDVPGTPGAWQQAASIGTGRQAGTVGAGTSALDEILTNAGQLPSQGLRADVKTALDGVGAGGEKTATNILHSLDDATSTTTTGNMNGGGALLTPATPESAMSIDPVTGEMTGNARMAPIPAGEPTAADLGMGPHDPLTGKPIPQATPTTSITAPTTAPTSATVEGGSAGGAAQAQEVVDPTSEHQLLQQIRTEISHYNDPNVQYSVEDAKTLASLKNAASVLENHLFGNGIDQAVADYTVSPEMEQQIMRESGGNQKLSSYIIDGINNAKTGAEIKAFQAPLVKASILGRAAANKAGGLLPGTLEAQTQAALDRQSNPLISNDTQAMLNAAHPVLGGAGKLANAAKGPVTKVGSGVANMLTKSVGKGNAGNLISVLSQIAAHVPNYAGTPASGTMQEGNNAMNPYQTQGMSDPNIMQEITQAGILDPAAVPALQGALKAQQAQPLLSNLENQYGQAGGGQGMGGGLLSELSSFIPGTAAYQYHQEMGAMASQIAQATGLDPKAVMALLPSLMANPQGAEGAFGSLQGAVNAGVPNQGLQGAFAGVQGPSTLGSL